MKKRTNQALSQEYSSLPHAGPVQMLVYSLSERTNGGFFPTLLDPGVQGRLCLSRCKACLLDPMLLHPVVSQHVAGAVPAALVAVLVQPGCDTRDDQIGGVLQIGQRTVEGTFVGGALHLCQHPERLDIDAVVLPDAVVHQEGGPGQEARRIALFHRLWCGEHTSHERKQLPGDQQWLVAQKSPIGGDALLGKVISPEPGVGVGSRVPCSGLSDGSKRRMAGHEARQGQDSQVFNDVAGLFVRVNSGTRQAGPPFQALLLSSQYTIA